VEAVQDELEKAAKSDEEIQKLVADFNQLYEANIVENYSDLQQIAQKVKDRYHLLFSEAMKDCAAKYDELKNQVTELITEIDALPHGLNEEIKQKAIKLKQYAEQRSNANIELDFDVKDKISRFTYSEVLSFIDLYNSKKGKIDILKAELIKEKPQEPAAGQPPKTKTFVSKLPGHKLKVADYKNWLRRELQRFASVDDNDEITIE
jgi:hypothetical protein